MHFSNLEFWRGILDQILRSFKLPVGYRDRTAVSAHDFDNSSIAVFIVANLVSYRVHCGQSGELLYSLIPNWSDIVFTAWGV